MQQKNLKAEYYKFERFIVENDIKNNCSKKEHFSLNALIGNPS